MRERITPGLIDSVVALVPDDWFIQADPDTPPADQRDVYSRFLKVRLENSKIFVDHAIDIRKTLV